MFATTEPQRIFHALQDRLERFDLEDYNNQELAKIIYMRFAGIDCSDEILLDMANYTRGNARSADMLGRKIRTYLDSQKITKIDDNLWVLLKHKMSIYPFGLEQTEVNILKALSMRGKMSLSGLGSISGLTVEALRRNVEQHLIKHSLMAIETNGRKITGIGVEYLKNNKL